MGDWAALVLGLMLGAACALTAATLRLQRLRLNKLREQIAVRDAAIEQLRIQAGRMAEHLDSLDRDCARFADKLGMSRDGGVG